MPRTSQQRERAQPGTGVQSDTGAIDRTVLDRLLADDQEAVGVVLRQFRASCPADASALGAALSSNDDKGTLRWAHRLKGACLMVGAASLADACARAEVAVRRADSGLAAAAIAAIDCEAARVISYLDARLNASS